MNAKNRFILINLLAFEFILLNLILIGYLFFRIPEFSFTDVDFLIKVAKIAIIYTLSWLFIILYIRDNEFYFDPKYGYLKSILTSTFFFVGFVSVLLILLKINYFNRSTFIFPIFIFAYINLISHKYLLKYLKKKGAHLFSDALLVGPSSDFSNRKGFINTMAQYGYNIIGHLKDPNEIPENNLDVNIIGDINDLPHILNTNSVDEIFIDMSALDQQIIKNSIRIADSFGVRVKLIPQDPLFMAKNYKVVTMGGLAVFKLRQSKLDLFNMTILKRLFDFSFALMVLILFFPIYLLIAVIIRFETKGPVFYTPYRKGEASKTFKCYKFRTMLVSDNPLNGTKSTIVNDPRITRVGKFLRKSDLDELPQFFNVLKGEMSVIGPRPHRVNLQNDFRKSVNDYMVRSYVKPGITGWAQVNGWRGPTATDEQKNERINHDLWYIENWSFWLDLKIVFLTLFGNHRKKAF